MRHSVYGRKFSRTKDERKRLFTGLIRSLFTENTIITTLAKAKAIQPAVEKLITRAKKENQFDFRQVLRVVPDRKLAKQISDEAKTRFSARHGGYTRIVKLGRREGDASMMVQLSFVDARVETTVIAPKKEMTENTKKEKKPAARPEKKTVKKSSKK